MVGVIRPNAILLSGFYFRPCRNEYHEAIPEYFRCRCGTHVLCQLHDHVSVMLQATTAETGSVLNFVRHSSR
ncbi:hypothetical protein JG687_00018544 [Phytophthora cactorum]|uniref:Uncharacterized protein n=1 Tax=Phytophthora cactorum TaxID=29920 RepID=A0A8T1TPJ2_9STRA|nr:hypothetical protein JG687_00018544 [Phytophthora cactorum]